MKNIVSHSRFGPELHGGDREGDKYLDIENQSVKIISILSSNSFERDCVWKSLRPAFPSCEFLCFGDEEKWENDCRTRNHPQTILYSASLSSLGDDDSGAHLRNFISRAKGHRVIVIAQSEDMNSWLDAVEFGAEGYIPPSDDLDNLIEMIRICSPRNFLMPRSSVKALRNIAQAQQCEATECRLERWFTERQLDVARALQRGSANKEIAYKLKISESTVKVHIRNIMRKVDATNRTQAAFLLNQIAIGGFVPKEDIGLRQN